MDLLLDVLTGPARGWVSVVFIAVCLLVLAVYIRRWIGRRTALKAFAARHGLRYVGPVSADARAPFIYFDAPRSTALVSNVIEGPWEGLDVAMYERPLQNRAVHTEVIVALPRDVTPFRLDPPNAFDAARAVVGERLGGRKQMTAPHAALSDAIIVSDSPNAAVSALGSSSSALIASRPEVTVETHFSYLRVDTGRRLDVEELPAFLGFATSLARALAEDSRR